MVKEFIEMIHLFKEPLLLSESRESLTAGIGSIELGFIAIGTPKICNGR